MSLLFRKRIKLAPGIYVNISKSGISLNLGVPGFNTTIGRNQKSTIGLPGTGISYQIHHGKSGNKNSNQVDNDKPVGPIPFIREAENIISVSPDLIDSGELAVVNSLYAEVLKNDETLKKELTRSFNEKNALLKRLRYLKFILIGFVSTVKDPINESIKFYEDRIIGIKEDQSLNYLNMNYSIENDILEKYLSLVEVFKMLANVSKIWDINRIESNDKIATRSFAGTTVKRVLTNFSNSEMPNLRCDQGVMKLKNRNGADIYFYPSFVMFYTSRDEFAAVGYDQLQITYIATSFLEEDEVPSDTVVIGKTWSKVNTDGSRDKRFKNNYEISIVRYGKLIIKKDNIIYEVFQISNFEIGEEFYKSLISYQNEIECIH